MIKYEAPDFDDPYPPTSVRVTGFRYENAIILLRLKSSVKMRSGKFFFMTRDREAKYVVGGSYTVHWTGSKGETGTITVPQGMLTDLTSVPPIFRGLINRIGPWLEAAIVHDFLCIAWRTMDGEGTIERRWFADQIMWAAMTEAKVGFQKYLIYGAIRAAARFIFPQRVDPTTQNDLYIDLSESEVQAQLPPDVRITSRA